MYKPVDSKTNFPRMEEGILKFWQDKDIFRKSLEIRKDAEEFVFYDGPPFATGLPHYGHFVPGTVKDIIPRYQTMKGKYVERRFGWDCHGLPVEYEMEKELGISGKNEIETFGIAKFNESCRSIVLRYTGEWRSIITRMGRWVDFDHDYKTMEPDYMESIWWVVKQLWDRKLMYEGFYILPYCPRCTTVLSNHELNLGGYKDVHDPAITVKFSLDNEENTFMLAWTTTPWTLPSNLALAVGEDIDYVKVEDSGEKYILAKELLHKYYKDESEYRIIETIKGSSLKGKRYKPLFPYFSGLKDDGAFVVVTGDYVTTEDGTGIVHTAPGFGEDDYTVLKDTGIPVVCPIDAEGRFTDEVSDYKGIFVKAADKQIIADLKEQGRLVKRENHLHPYPHCWRCSEPLIYRAISSWFVDIGKIKDKMIRANSKIYWMPAHLKEGRFGNWLENARDWAISRNRYWGNPIPVWKCDSCENIDCIGSRKELEEKSGIKLNDLHKHFVDEVHYRCSCGGKMSRIEEVLDCWFESGSMPYAQTHYPFEHKKHFEEHFPADFIAEGLDQTRGWFYTLVILAAALFDKPPFENVVVNGLVLAEDGKKMSKSLRNFSDPVYVINKFGADALRLFLMNSSVVKALDLRFSDEGVKDVLKNILIPLWNSYSFFVTYANIDNASPEKAPENPENPLDKWIISEAEKMVAEVTNYLDLFDLQNAISPIVNFTELLNNWYIRRSRRRFWRSENDNDKTQAYQTLYSVIMKAVLCAAPIIPFITEEIYQNIKTDSMHESVHLCDFPLADDSLRDNTLEFKMEMTRKTVSMGRALRSMHNLKTRQPLKGLHIVTIDQEAKKVLREMSDIIREELNVKEVIFRENENELVEYSAKANFKILGKILGPKMGKAAAGISKLSMSEIQSLIDGATLSLDIDGENLEITVEHVVIQRFEKENLKVLNEGILTVALDPEITDELKMEGNVRDLIRIIQNMRKEKGFEVTDRIEIFIEGDEEIIKGTKVFNDHLMQETLCTTVHYKATENSEEISIGESSCRIAVKKI